MFRFTTHAATLALALGLVLSGGRARGQAPSLVDATGVRFDTAHPARRIISLAPSLTEEVFELGADPVLIADTTFCLYPAGARTKTKIGNTLSPNLELIVALHPDLVLATIDGNREATVTQLRRLGLRVFVMGHANSFADIASQFRSLAQLVGRVAAGAAALQKAEADIAGVRARVAHQPPLRTFFEIEGPQDLVSASDATYLGEILADAGAINVMGNSRIAYPHLSTEAVLKANPAAILVADEQADPQAAVKAWSRFPDLAPARQHRIYLVPSSIFDQPTPATFAQSVVIAAQCLHPEAK